MGSQAARQAGRQVARQPGRQAGKQEGRHADRQAGMQAYRHARANSQTEFASSGCRNLEKQTDVGKSLDPPILAPPLQVPDHRQL